MWVIASILGYGLPSTLIFFLSGPRPRLLRFFWRFDYWSRFRIKKAQINVLWVLRSDRVCLVLCLILCLSLSWCWCHRRISRVSRKVWFVIQRRFITHNSRQHPIVLGPLLAIVKQFLQSDTHRRFPGVSTRGWGWESPASELVSVESIKAETTKTLPPRLPPLEACIFIRSFGLSLLRLRADFLEI